MKYIWHTVDEIPNKLFVYKQEDYETFEDYYACKIVRYFDNGCGYKFVDTDFIRERNTETESEEEYRNKWNLYVKVEKVLKWAYFSDFMDYCGFYNEEPQTKWK